MLKKIFAFMILILIFSTNLLFVSCKKEEPPIDSKEVEEKEEPTYLEMLHQEFPELKDYPVVVYVKPRNNVKLRYFIMLAAEKESYDLTKENLELYLKFGYYFDGPDGPQVEMSEEYQKKYYMPKHQIYFTVDNEEKGFNKTIMMENNEGSIFVAENFSEKKIHVKCLKN